MMFLIICSQTPVFISQCLLLSEQDRCSHNVILFSVTCRVDHDCFLGHICLHNMCIFGCHSDEDCSASETCRDNRCTNPCAFNPCGPNSVCAITNHRATCSCRQGLVPNPSAQVKFYNLQDFSMKSKYI